MATARELAIRISGDSSSASAALNKLYSELRAFAAAVSSANAAGSQMTTIYGSQGQVLSRVAVGASALAPAMTSASVAMNSTRVSMLNMRQAGMALQGAMSGMGLGMLSMQLGMLGVGAGAGLAAGMVTKAAFDIGVSWESAFAGVRKTVDATPAQLAVLSSGIREMAQELPASREEIARVMEGAGQLGISNDSLLTFTRTMVDMGVATNMTSEQAATALARMANITRMPQSDFDQLGSTIVDLGNKFAGTEAEIAEFGLRIAGAGHQIGLTESQILAWGTAMSSVGIEPEAGGTAISRTFIDMAAAVNKGGAALDQFGRVAGMSGREFATLFKGDANTAAIAFITGLDRMRGMGMDVFGTLEQLGMSEIRQRDALLRLSSAYEEVNRASNVAAEAWRENSALTEEAGRRYETTASKIEIAKNKWTDLAVSGFEASQPAINSTIDAAGNLAGLIGRMADTTAVAVPVTTALGIAIDGLLAPVNALLTPLRDVTGLLGMLGTITPKIALPELPPDIASKLPGYTPFATLPGGKGGLKGYVEADWGFSEEDTTKAMANIETYKNAVLGARLDAAQAEEDAMAQSAREGKTTLAEANRKSWQYESDEWKRNVKPELDRQERERKAASDKAASEAIANAERVRDAQIAANRTSVEEAIAGITRVELASTAQYRKATENKQAELDQLNYRIALAQQPGADRSQLGTMARQRAQLERDINILGLESKAVAGPEERAVREALNPPLPAVSMEEYLNRIDTGKRLEGLLKGAYSGTNTVNNAVNITIADGKVIAAGGNDPEKTRQLAQVLTEAMTMIFSTPAGGQGGASPQLAGAQ